MNILFYLTRYPGVGGIENVTNMVISKLLKDNHISILSHVQQEGILALEGVNLYSMPNKKNWTAARNFDYADEIVGGNHFDAIIYQDSYCPTEHIVCEVARKYNVPLYVFEHNSPLFVYNKRDLDPIMSLKGFLRFIFHPYILYKEKKRKRYLLENSSKYVLLSRGFIPEFCKLIGADENDPRITYINNPILPIESHAKIEKDNIILCVSRLAKEKCVDKMLMMWKQLVTEQPNWRFVIVGDGPERVSLEKFVQINHIPRIEFTGFAQPLEYYQRSKIFWMTSKFEGWGITLVEAMQRLCVPIAFDTYSSLHDIIDNGENGIICPPDDLKAFREATLTLVNDDSIREKMANNAREKTQIWEIDNVMKEWSVLLNEIRREK